MYTLNMKIVYSVLDDYGTSDLSSDYGKRMDLGRRDMVQLL